MNKEEWKIWRKEWKENYKTLSALIKQLKKDRKTGTFDERSMAQSKLHYKRIEARGMMDQLTMWKDDYKEKSKAA